MAGRQLRDVRTSPESPALWPDALFSPLPSLLIPSDTLLHLSRGNGRQRPFHPPFLPRVVSLPTEARMRRREVEADSSRRCIMPRGDKSAYTDKQKREAEHIEEGYERRGVDRREAERRAWATVNKET